jgi:hypothetical protein
MALAFNPFDNLTLHKMTIAGKQSPGIVRFRGLSLLKRDFEEKTVKGQSGSTIKFDGRRGSHFSILFELYDPEDWGDWGDLLPELKKDPTGASDKAVAVSHPYLTDADVAAVCIEEIIAPDDHDTGDLYIVELKCIQYMGEPKKAVTKISGSASGGAKPAPTSPEQAAADAQLNNVNQQLDAVRQSIAKRQAAAMGKGALDGGGG